MLGELGRKGRAKKGRRTSVEKMSAGNLVDMVEAMEEKVPLADGDSSHLRRMDTNDSLSRYIQIVGENSAAIHDRPKKKQAKWFEKQSDLYGKTVSNTANATVNWLPAQVRDLLEQIETDRGDRMALLTVWF